MGCSHSSSRLSRKGNTTTPTIRVPFGASSKPQQGNKKIQKNEVPENNNPTSDSTLDNYLCRGQRYLAKGRQNDAFDMFCMARDILEETTPDSLDLASVYYELGRMLMAKNQNNAGTTQLKKALLILEDVPPCHEAAQVLNILSKSPTVSILQSKQYRQRAADIVNELQGSEQDEEEQKE